MAEIFTKYSIIRITTLNIFWKKGIVWGVLRDKKKKIVITPKLIELRKYALN